MQVETSFPLQLIPARLRLTLGDSPVVVMGRIAIPASASGIRTSSPIAGVEFIEFSERPPPPSRCSSRAAKEKSQQ
jgi:hypothetical protein